MPWGVFSEKSPTPSGGQSRGGRGAGKGSPAKGAISIRSTSGRRDLGAVAPPTGLRVVERFHANRDRSSIVSIGNVRPFHTPFLPVRVWDELPEDWNPNLHRSDLRIENRCSALSSVYDLIADCQTFSSHGETAFKSWDGGQHSGTRSAFRWSNAIRSPAPRQVDQMFGRTKFA